MRVVLSVHIAVGKSNDVAAALLEIPRKPKETLREKLVNHTRDVEGKPPRLSLGAKVYM